MQCVHCGKPLDPIKENPYAGTALGAEIQSQVCDTCWKEWERLELMVINEYRLIPFQKQHRELLLWKMREYLKMKR